MVYSSRQVAKMLGVNPSRLARCIWDERLVPPPKGPGGFYLWGPEDIERASWVLRGKPADDVLKIIADSAEATNGE